MKPFPNDELLYRYTQLYVQATRRVSDRTLDRLRNMEALMLRKMGTPIACEACGAPASKVVQRRYPLWLCADCATK